MPCCGPPEAAPLVAVLAAGAASRFGASGYGAKLDAMLAGKQVGQWVLDAVADAGLPHGVIVVGPQIPAFARASGWPLLVNDRAAEGLGTSLGMAAARALAAGRRLLVLLADMPLVDAAYLQGLVAGEGATATAWPQGKPGVPACLPPALLPGLAALKGDAGAGGILSASAGVTRLVPPPHLLLDIDRPEDLVAAEAWLSRRG